MPYRKINIWNALDWKTVGLYLVLVIAGWFSIYAASYDFDQVDTFDLSGRLGQQLLWIGISLVVGFFILMIDNDWYDIFAYWIYFLIILLLIATIFLAKDIKGSRSWLVIGSAARPLFSIQPAEFAKFATALALAKLLNSYKFQLMEPRNFMRALALIFVPFVLILLQKETGSALVFLAFLVVLYREGMPGVVLFSGLCAIVYFVIGIKFSETFWENTPVGELVVLLLILGILIGMVYDYKKGKNNVRYLLIGSFGVLLITFALSFFFIIDFSWVVLGIILAAAIFLLSNFVKYRAKQYLFIALFSLFSAGFLYSVDYVFNDVLEPHHQVRIKVTLGMIDDPSGAGYNVNQSKIAIGSGGVWGKGFLNGTQTKLKYVPEQDTDFIFCTIGEEKGFLGTTLVLLLYMVFIIRLVFLAERQKNIFNRVYGYSVASIFFFHFAINIGMVIGITPVIGIPLPFFSYGGSSLLAFTILLFIFLRLDASRRERL